jgi:hypothetical protein
MTLIVTKDYSPAGTNGPPTLVRARPQWPQTRRISLADEASGWLACGRSSWRLYRGFAARRLSSESILNSRKRVSGKSILITCAAVAALWAPVYMSLLDHIGPAVLSEPLQWVAVIVGATGLGGVIYTCWKDTRDPAWRAAHGLAQKRSGATEL